MADDRKPYTVNVAGVDHTMLLTDEDAKRYGVRAQVKAAEPKNKARTASNKTK